MIKQDVLDRVRLETDIVDTVGNYLPLKKVGRNYRGLCPFHPERSPSFYVSPERQTYHCFGCGAGGNVISFVMAQEKLAFPEAVRLLAAKLGIEISYDSEGRNRALYDACENAAQYFERQLRRSEGARQYLDRRGVRPETLQRFRLGFAPGGNRLRGEVKRRGWSEEGMVGAGLLARRADGLSDYFYDRLMFPIFSVSGRVVGFGGRVLDDREPKYLNSPDTAIFHKGEILYGLFQAKGYIREETPVLVEGNFDLLALVGSGLNSTVAPLGTALTAEQAALVRRYNHRVLVCFDGDEAGRKAARRALETLLRGSLDPQTVSLPAGMDPDDYLKKHGRSEFDRLLGEPQDFVDFVLGTRVMDSVVEERAALREVVTLLHLVPDGATRELYANRIAARFNVNKDVILRSKREAQVTRPPRRDEMGVEEMVLAVAIQVPALARVAREVGLADTIADERLRAVAILSDQHCEDPDFGPALLLDLIGSEEMQRRVAGWTFIDRPLPSPQEFRAKVGRMRADWLQRQIVAAQELGKEDQVEVLSRERVDLLNAANQERSS